MLVTKHAAELCALLVNDFYGELPSRVLIALLNKGRCHVAQLSQLTALGARHVRNALGVLIQQNLAFHHTDPTCTYQANPAACYDLVRSGKILEVIGSQYGTEERDLVQTLMLLGFAKIGDLTQAFDSRRPKVNGHTNGSHESSTGLIESETQFHTVLGRLIWADIIELVHEESFRHPADIYHECVLEVTKAPPGEKTTKAKADQNTEIMDRYRNFRDRKNTLKRHFRQGEAPMAKRRKLSNGSSPNGHAYRESASDLNPNIVVRINHEKCLVLLRNKRLATFASETLGEATGAVYHTLLQIVTAQTARCKPDPLCDDTSDTFFAPVTTVEIYDRLDESVDVSAGIGKPREGTIDFTSAEKIQPQAPTGESDSEDSDAEPPVRRQAKATLDSDDGDTDESGQDLSDQNTQKSKSITRPNGDGKARVQFEDGVISDDNRLDHMRQHLLLLAENQYKFIRHCGTVGRGQWTVDFRPLMSRLRETELDAFIEQSFGRHGLRLTRILREKGKLDEKMLPSAALMKKSDVQGKMLAMQMAGLVDVQEVPKDNSRLANRTLFFWFFDGDRTQSQLLDDIYKAMLRCLQTLEVERHKERNILSFVERKDVKGKEEEVMTAEHYNKYNRHLETQNKLLGQVMRLDDMVATIRDY